MSFSIQCEHCQAVLKSPVAVPAGKKVKCPKCQRTFTTPGDAAKPEVAPAAAHATLDEDDEMARAIAKLEAEQAGGKPAPAPQPAATPAPTPPPSSPPADSLNEDDEMAAAIAKLEAEQAASSAKKPAAPEPKPAPAAPPPKEPAQEEIPEIDDDLVVPDDEEEEPAAKKPAAKGPPPPPLKKKKDEADDDEPRPKKKRRDDDEDDEPRAKKKKRRDDDEDDDDEPRAKKKRRDVDEDDQDDAITDKPGAVKKSRRGADEDDEDEDDRSGKQPKKAGGKLVLFSLLGLGGVFLCLCLPCGGGGIYYFTRPAIVGEWQAAPRAGNEHGMVWSFDYFGSGSITEREKAGGGDYIETIRYFSYTLSGSDPMILKIKGTRMEFRHSNPAKQRQMEEERRNLAEKMKGKFKDLEKLAKELANVDPTITFQVTVEGDTLTMTMVDAPFGLGRIGKGVPTTLTRVR